jgi:hypothetical protein
MRISQWRQGWQRAWAGLPREPFRSREYDKGFDVGKDYKAAADYAPRAYQLDKRKPYVAPSV